MRHTVRELIGVLQALPDQDMAVTLEGCDCTGPWNGEVEEIAADDWTEYALLLLCRGDHGDDE